MIQSIQPVISSFRFGTADTLKIELHQDNLADWAMFSVRIGKIGEDGFISDEPSLQYVTLSGEDYAEWDGSNEAAVVAIIAKLPGIEAAK